MTALYAALWAVEATEVASVPPGARFGLGITEAVALGDDTDTVAAIAGALLGARCSLAGIPVPWREVVHGWPGMDAEDLTRMSGEILRG